MYVLRCLCNKLRIYPIFNLTNVIRTGRYFREMANKWQASQMKDQEQWVDHLKGHVAVTVSEDQTETSAVFPGFSYGDLDRTGDVEPWKILMLIQTGEDNCAFRGKAQHGRDAFDMAEVLKGNLVFTVTTKLEIMQELYTKKDDFLYQPVTFKSYLNKVGNTSMEIVRELHCQKGFPLARSTHNLVVVDKETHTPVKHSEAFIKKFGKTKPRIQVERFIPDEKPSDSFKTKYVVTWSDLDYYYHSNQCSYLRYAINGATEAYFTGCLKKFFAGDLAHHKIKCMTMLYAAQSKPGDNLDIYVWEDKLIDNRIHIQLEKEKQLIYNTTVDFFDQKVLDKGASQESSKM